MIYCCGGYHEPQQTVILLPDGRYKDRKLELIVCPNCGNIAAVLTQFNIFEKKYETYRPQRKKTLRFIKKIQEQQWKVESVKNGTKSKAGFIYGVNIQAKNGKIYQFAVDFNGKRKLVKVI